MQEISPISKFNELFSELEDCDEDEQRQKIEEMNEIIDKTNGKEFISVFSEKLFNKINTMIEEKKLLWGNAILLLKHVGFWNILKAIWICGFEKSLLIKGFEKMIIEEEKKKEEKDENYLVDLCECYLMHLSLQPSELFSICVPCLLKFALKKEESKETQKEVEITLLALSNIDNYELKKELFLDEIKEIIKNHQEHYNLTRLAYQSVCAFLVNRFHCDYREMEDLIVNELHLVKEATREMEELISFEEYEGESEEEKEESEREADEGYILIRWLCISDDLFCCCGSWNEDILGLMKCVTGVYRATNEWCNQIGDHCFYCFKSVGRRIEGYDLLLKSGAIDAVLKELWRKTLYQDIFRDFLMSFANLWRSLDEKRDEEMEEKKRKVMKRKILERLEEEGFEDCINRFRYCVFVRYFDTFLTNGTGIYDVLL
ncbi:uncharacterized protein MONOS_6929 [Monocercomonoides exilis]|uniref:uncharacterized protein n=1 Tax=Monocercomonoides exilis TaxID=2049356 RepID=UPI00355A3E0C|nr:hypothetical protein MONOS_6929 [Monocercomonoides exilis]|eukprot:MONOS_6929.1-p1 / transcript=MONOS_6929.1 / gene=MONOS_6929 / organism=Monocercomonoides_exilis_PA203 / gene_product=unspecified product / transcript_product=unspecified product / location=Mono_scaffold00227:61240-62654(-) / protein_length=431 / sequence_SO=supercontig / SO=protein_coding / is_pseudo=false